MEALPRLGPADLVAAMVTYRDALRRHQEAINRLNVYPVPDGDTGTNMALTLASVVSELDQAKDEIPTMAAVCRAVAHGSLMGARGNSGVILSQLLRGLTATFVSSTGPDGHEMAAALQAAAAAALQAIMRPVEGTILTVARAAGEGAARSSALGADLVGVLEGARDAAAEALARTPELLAVLARAGVVDAGGSGYLLLIDAFLTVVDGRPLPEAPVVPEVQGRGFTSALPDVGGGEEDRTGPSGATLDLRYEVMYLLEAPDEAMTAFREVWMGIGDSIVTVGGEGIWNCHIHTDDIGAAIEAALDVGRPRNIRVSDLAEQVEEERWVRAATTWGVEDSNAAGPLPRTAVVAVANGDGIGRIFRSLGVHHLVPGGQSMNPSTADIVKMIEDSGSPEVVVLPNNDNVLPVALQAAELADRLVEVVATSGIVEGFAALLEYDPQASAEVNARSMAESARRVVAGEVTQAVRDAVTDIGEVRAGEWLGLSRDGVEVVAGSVVDAVCGLLGKLVTDDHELVTLFEGDGAGTGETRQVSEWLADHHGSITVEVHHGGQLLYPYLISIE